MGLETGTYINDLNVANPVGTDPKSQGDDHFRLIKTTLKNTFPLASSGVLYSNGTAAATSIATAVQITTAIGTQAVTNATNATNSTNVDINGKTEDTAPDVAADFVLTYDTSAAGLKKVKLQELGQGKQTIWVPAPAMITRTTTGAAAGTVETATNKIMVKTYDFDQTTQEHVQFSVRMPKSWNLGTVSATFLWSAASGSGNVVWGISAVAISDDDVIDAAFGTAVTVTDTLTATTDLMQTAETGALTIAGSPAVGDYIVFQVHRVAADANDTLAVDARLHGVAVFYTTEASTDA